MHLSVPEFSLFTLPFFRRETPKTQTKARVAALLYLSTC